MMAHTRTWTVVEAAPVGTDAMSSVDNAIRALTVDIRERMAIDHEWKVGSSSDGYHLAAHLKERSADPTNVAGYGIIYAKESGSLSELFFEDDAGTVTQLTTDGKLNTAGMYLFASSAQGDLIYLSAENTYARLAKDANATRVLCNTGTTNNPKWDQVNLATGVTGTLPDTNLDQITTASKVHGTAITGLASVPSGAGYLPSANIDCFKTGDLIFSTVSTSRTGWTNVSSTYSNKFIRINATPLTQSGSDTHTHAAGSFVGPSHTHSVPASSTGWGYGTPVAGGLVTSAGGANVATIDKATAAGGTGSITGTSASGNNVPAYVTVSVFQRD